MAQPRREHAEAPAEQRSVNSEAVEDFVGLSPSWLLRAGNVVSLLVFLALVAGAWVIEYPDLVRAPVSLTTEDPPAPVVARNSGRLLKLWIDDGAIVQRDEWLAVIDNSAKTEDVRTLAELLRAFARELGDPLRFDAEHYRLGTNLDLGEMQVEYASFIAAWIDFRSALADPYFDASGERIGKQLHANVSLSQSLLAQRHGLVEDLDQAKQDANEEAKLAEQGALALRDVNGAKSLVRERKRTLDASDIEQLRIRLDRAVLDRERLDLAREFRDQQRERLRNVREAYAALVRSYENWRRNYLLVAPTTGRVSLDHVWSEQQWIALGDEVLSVVPIAEKIIGRIALAQANSGKVEVGQRVVLKLDSYPFREYGTVEGVVTSISPVARAGIYTVTIALPNGLLTHHHRSLELRHDMRGSAEIITAKRRLLERIFVHFDSLMSNQ